MNNILKEVEYIRRRNYRDDITPTQTYKIGLGPSVTGIIQTASEDLKEFSNRVLVDDDGVLKVKVKSKETICYKYGMVEWGT